MVDSWPGRAPDAGAVRRLGPYLLVAALLHGLAGLGLRLPDPAGTQVPPPLRLSWSKPPSPAVVPLRQQPSESSPEPVSTSGSRNLRGAVAIAPARVPRVAIPEPPAPAAVTPPNPSAPAVEPVRAPAGADLLEGARRMARDIGREAAREGGVSGSAVAVVRATPSAVDRAVLPELDRALRKRPAGEERLGGGILRITTESGRVYCLKPPSDLVRDGPVEPLAVPTNCP
ncbi:hypothetical protein [Zoogloea sp. LCSB751]|uniref:hypothetical protein n=1 Tax=Zoogloea sp. LCSB751 TaxID=1965277 RepID=UPI0011160694|nr:hypothetical protein [Zoogloea sp. LCSB751]